MGIDDVLRARQERLVGILNGIDTTVWDPANDRHLAEPYAWGDMAGKAAARRAVLDEMALPDLNGPLLVMVSRLVEQKGVDLLVPALDMVERMPLQVAVLGDGDAAAGRRAGRGGRRASRSGSRSGRATTRAWPTPCSPAATSSPCRAASSRAASRRCRPCATGRCRSSPTSAGCTTRSSTSTTARGTEPASLQRSPTSLAVLDALHRGVRAHAAPARRKAMQKRGMAHDWSWAAPARQHLELYQELLDDRGSPS